MRNWSFSLHEIALIVAWQLHVVLSAWLRFLLSSARSFVGGQSALKCLFTCVYTYA